MKYIISVSCCFVGIWFSAFALAEDNSSQSLGEEVLKGELNTQSKESTPVVVNETVKKGLGATVSIESSSGLPQAENVDLKKVIPDPQQAPPQVPSVSPVSPIQAIAPNQVVPVPSEKSSQTTLAEDVLQKKVDSDDKAKPIQLLGAEVLPGTATRLSWSAQDSLKGISIPTPVLVVHGEKSGPIMCLTGAVHGDELNGIEVVRKVLYELNPKKLSGSVIGVPIVNIQGFIRGSRYLTDRRDLNRYFPGRPDGSSAARIAFSFFTQVIQRCDYLIDIHTGSFRRTNLPQLRADLHVERVTEMTQNMGSIVVLHSHGAVGSLRRAAVEAGVVAVTIEAGEPLNITLDAVKHGVRSIETFMHKIDMYPRPAWMWAVETKPVYFGSRWVRSSAGGILLSEIRLGERVSEQQVLGVVTDPITNVATSIKSPTAGQVIGMALNQVMLPGFAAYHIGYQATVEEAATHDAGPDDYAGDDAGLDEDEGMPEN